MLLIYIYSCIDLNFLSIVYIGYYFLRFMYVSGLWGLNVPESAIDKLQYFNFKRFLSLLFLKCFYELQIVDELKGKCNILLIDDIQIFQLPCLHQMLEK